MQNINPDFRGADEVIKPENAEFGWAVNVSEAEAILLERRGEERLQAEMPAQMTFQEEEEPLPGIVEAWNTFQQSKGRFPGSYDWSILDEFVSQGPILYPAQIIGSCFKGDTLIRMADGTHKPIADIRVFEQVLTAEGNISHVSATMGRCVNEELYSIQLWGHSAVEMTCEHPVLTKRGYVKAQEVTLEDYVWLPAYLPQSANILITSEHVHCNQQLRRRIAKGEHVGRHKVRHGASEHGYVNVYRKVPDAIELNEQFGWLIGVALAEGGTDGNKVVFTFHKDEQHTLAKKVIETFKNLFDVEAVFSITRVRSCKVSVHSVAWASLFDSLIGKRPEGKRLHKDLIGGGKEFLSAVLEGWIDGDGHEKAGAIQGTTVSKQLALDMLAIANGIGLTARLSAVDPKVSHGVKHRNRRYDVYLPKGETLCCEKEEKGTWRKVRGISLNEYSGKVYNFEVHGDNSYVADGLGVHNCVVSNTLPGWVAKLMYQIVFLGLPMEYIGRDQRGSNNYAPYGPYSYGAARKRVNLRGGDGLFCEGMVESLLKDGVLPCSNPDLIALNKKLGVDRPQDYFEPQNPAVYRAWGDWKYVDEFSKYADYRVGACPYVKSADELLKALKVCDSTFVCSMLAIKKIGQHKDGFAIHGRNPGDQWAHNMRFQGILVASDGAVFIRMSNESWGVEHMYTVPISEVDDWFRRRNLTAAAIGKINGPSSSPPLMGV
jgi:hypothetical protein